MMKNMSLLALAVLITGLKGVSLARTPQIEISPKHVMVKAGEQVTVLCWAGEAADYCRFMTPSGRVLNLSPTRPSKDEYTYAGEGPANGQCGFKIESIQDHNNGVYGCYMGLTEEAFANMTIVVARPPFGLPELNVGFHTPGTMEISGVLQENYVLKAACGVHDSRPAANITWFLDENQIFEGLSPVALEPPTCIDEGSLCTSRQNLTRSVTWNDNGKRLGCVMSHFAQDIGAQNRTIYQLNVQYKPRDDESSTEKIDFEVGKPGTITKLVHANPKPTFQWNIGNGVWLNEGEKSGRYKAEDGSNNGQGSWVAKLQIDALTASDVEQVYQLRARNDVGFTDFQVSISTMNAPQGATIGAGAIVGIVASILLVLIIIFLLIFARTTGRWCFSPTSSAKGKGSHSNSEAHIDPEIPQPTKIEVTQEDTDGGMDNPANHDVNNEYINDNDDVKKPPIDSDKDTQV